MIAGAVNKRSFPDSSMHTVGYADSASGSMPQSPHLYQSSPSISAGCWVRSEPLPHSIAFTEQKRSQPQQVRSGCLGCSGNFFAMSEDLKNKGFALIFRHLGINHAVLFHNT